MASFLERCAREIPGAQLGDDALALVRLAVEANAPTVPAGPPPSGADLARRRRFH